MKKKVDPGLLVVTFSASYMICLRPIDRTSWSPVQ